MRLIQFLFIFSLVLTVSFETHAQDPAPAAEIANSAVESEPPLESGQSETANPSELRFNFRYAPWQGVLDWFAEQADLSLVMDAPPPGTFNYTDGKPYSPSEAIDLMNSVLLTKGYTLVRREKMLIVVNLQDEIPPVLVETVALDELNDRGEYELVRCIFRVRKVEPGVAAEEIEKLIGPQGRVELLATAKQLMITETAGRLRTIRDVLQAMENPDGEKTEITELTLSHVKAEDAMPVIRQMLGLPEGQNANEAGTVRMTPTEQRILISASEEAIQQVKDVIKLVDLASPNGNGGIAEARQLEIYPIKGADSELALRVMLTVLADSQPPAELSTDPETGKLIALATTAQHATIRATLSQMQQAKQIEVIQLNTVDPQVAVLSINKMLGGGGEEPDENAPIVDADVTTGNLIIRATSEQIADIRSLLEKLGETEDGTGYSYASGTNNVRVLSLGPDAEALLKQAQLVWPLMGKNRIRTVTPSNVMRSAFPKVIERERNLDDAAPLDESDEAGDGSNSYELQPQRNPPVNEEAGHRQNHVTRLAQVTPSNVQADTAEPLPESANE
ncbi:MAG: hypothetical protein KDA87_17320, partial [Planctomycetales bacterium]|nr:hypothetical protein [Planctomycetales bacterium]